MVVLYVQLGKFKKCFTRKLWKIPQPLQSIVELYSNSFETFSHLCHKLTVRRVVHYCTVQCSAPQYSQVCAVQYSTAQCRTSTVQSHWSPTRRHASVPWLKGRRQLCGSIFKSWDGGSSASGPHSQQLSLMCVSFMRFPQISPIRVITPEYSLIGLGRIGQGTCKQHSA